MALSPELVARVHRHVNDTGPSPGFTSLGEADYDHLVNTLLARRDRSDDIWLFVYGSLIWKPACAIDGEMPALLRGWHRKFCLRLERYRGTREQPGLMMSLDHGGACRGVAQRLPSAHKHERLHQLVRRELSTKPFSHSPRWIRIESERGPIEAIVFAINRRGPNYSGHHSLEETALILSRACGHWGSGAEYLMHTVQHLEERGIHDRYLWALQERVAALITDRNRMPGGQTSA